jgi:adenylosuccinate synthase
MTVDLLLGLQWGDEGKGKIVDVPPNTILLLVFKEVQMDIHRI